MRQALRKEQTQPTTCTVLEKRQPLATQHYPQLSHHRLTMDSTNNKVRLVKGDRCGIQNSSSHSVTAIRARCSAALLICYRYSARNHL